MIEFQTDVPMPERPSRGAKRKYPLWTMPVGASFFVAKPLSSMTGSTSNAATSGKKFTLRSVTENDANGNPVRGVRIWRIE